MIRLGVLDWGDEEREAIRQLISDEDPILTMGPNVRKFESSFAKWIDVKYGIAVNSGSSALIIALNTLKITSDVTDVYTTSLVYPATWNAILINRMIPRYIDIDPETLNMDLSKPLEELTNRPSLFLGVHLFGKPLMYPFVDIEDGAQAIGSKIHNRRVGSFGKLSCFSFYVAHQVTTIEGGIILTDDAELAEICRSLRDNGRICTCQECTLKTKGFCQKRFEYDGERRWATNYVGFNMKPTEILGVLGLVKMKKINRIVERRHEILKMYNEALSDVSLLKEDEREYICPLAFPLLVKHPVRTVNELAKHGIESRGMFPARGNCPNAEYISNHSIMIPSHQNLTDDQVSFVIQKVKQLEGVG